MFIIYVTDLSTKDKIKTGAHIFTKIKNTDGSKKKKNLFFSYFIDRGSHFYKNKKYRWFKKEKKSIFQLFHFRDF